MKFKKKLSSGRLIKRYKRFLADILWNDTVITAHVPNTGSLATVISKDQNCLFSISDDPHRKLKYTLELIQSPTGAWVGVNTSNPNKIMKETLSQLLEEKKSLLNKKTFIENSPWDRWSQFDEFKSEIKISKETRLDFVLRKKNSDQYHYMEIKNVSMVIGSCAQFPDAVTERGQKHISELINLVKKGHTAELIFIIQRDDCSSFSPASHVDPKYSQRLKEAVNEGIIITPLVAQVSPEFIQLTQTQLPLVLSESSSHSLP